MQTRIEEMLRSQAAIRAMYHRGQIDEAIDEFDRVIRPAVGAVDPRVRRCALRLAESLIWMVDNDPIRDRVSKNG